MPRATPQSPAVHRRPPRVGLLWSPPCDAFKLHAGVDILHVAYRGGGESLPTSWPASFRSTPDPNTCRMLSAGMPACSPCSTATGARIPTVSAPVRRSIRSSIFLAGFDVCNRPDAAAGVRKDEALTRSPAIPRCAPLLLKPARPQPWYPRGAGHPSPRRKDHER